MLGTAATPAADGLQRIGAVAATRDITLAELDIPPEVLPHLTFPCTFDATRARAALAGTDIDVPDLDTYAPVLVEYWRTHLDPNRHRRGRPGPPLAGRRVVI